MWIWTNFFSIFTCIIDKDNDLKRVDKLQHLRSCWSSAAIDTLRSLEINGTNYKIVLDLFKKRLHNKRLIFQAHIRELFGMEKADADISKLRALTDKITSHLCAYVAVAGIKIASSGLHNGAVSNSEIRQSNLIKVRKLV